MTIETAIVYATEHHRGQVDKAGKPYILHPLRVMANLGPNAFVDEQIAALLHDVVEDCGVSLQDLRDAGFSDAVVEAVDHLTKNEDGERDYQLAIERVARNPIARRVKIADLTDNLDERRLPLSSTKAEERLAKYRAAKLWLENLG